MTEEIKEILDDMKQIPIDESWALNLEDYQCKLLLNYITNLQNENQKLKDTIKKDNHLLGCNFSKKDKYKQERNIYKQRNEKAIEYINNLRDENAEREGFYNCFPDDLYIANIEDLLNILKGGDE